MRSDIGSRVSAKSCSLPRRARRNQGASRPARRPRMQEMKQFQAGVQLERGDGVQRRAPGEEVDHLGRQDGGQDQRAEGFHGDGTQNDLGDEERAGNRRVVGRSDPGGGPAGENQAAPGHGPGSGPRHQGSHQRGQLHHRPFPADRAAGGDGGEGGQGFGHAGRKGQGAVAEGHGLHEIGGLPPARFKLAAVIDQQTGNDAAGHRQKQPFPGRQLGEDLNHAAAMPGEEESRQGQHLAERHR